ncbi:hypothetical protein [Nonomuraea dietziae]|uniref:hypothetical protein n=1 Tax=Nonomuraea dietziae TaxID=65515 RepID=UPI0034034A0C
MRRDWAWAIGIPLSVIACAWVSLNPWLFWPGIVVGTLLCFMAWIVTSMPHDRHGPGVLAMFGAFALLLFAGSAAYEAAMRAYGVRADVVVVAVEHRENDGGADWECQVARLDGTALPYTLTEATGCGEELARGRHVRVVEDPLGWLRPRLDEPPTFSAATQLGVAGGVTVGVEASILWGRSRPRPGRGASAGRGASTGPYQY